MPLLTGTAAAQDAGAIARAAAASMGTDTLQCITYSGGGGYAAIVGQGFSPADDWPRVELVEFSRVINFDAGTMREERLRRQGDYSAQGGGGMPIQEGRQIMLVSGDKAWNLNGTTVQPQPAIGDVRQLEIYLDPHGFLKGALAASDLVTFQRNEGGGERRNILAYTMGRFRIQGSLNADNEVVRIQTFVPSPLLGDMVEEKTYGNYQTFAGVKFPTNFHNHTNWDHELRPQGFYGVPDGGHNSFGTTINTVQPNACGAAITVPAEVQAATVPAVTVTSTEVADGVYHLTGGSHHSVAVEFADYIAVVEAPQNEARSLAVIAEVHRLIPEKPIKYVVNTHHHFDHSGGLRAYVHEGAIPIAHRDIVPYYYYAVMDRGRRTLEPDLLSLYPPDEFQETFVLEEVSNTKYTLSDGTRTMDLHVVQGNPHAQGMLMVHLPAERILVEADLFTAGQTFPTTVNAAGKSLYDNVQRLGLNVDRVVPVHGRVFTWSEFAAVASAGN
ncbi:MAG: MBL fold metallo-hydrolase [Acidobacteria bacterium]|nr:MBL fold metallo-hydrolase [Acidobacteriota bacterium]